MSESESERDVGEREGGREVEVEVEREKERQTDRQTDRQTVGVWFQPNGGIGREDVLWKNAVHSSRARREEQDTVCALGYIENTEERCKKRRELYFGNLA